MEPGAPEGGAASGGDGSGSARAGGALLDCSSGSRFAARGGNVSVAVAGSSLAVPDFCGGASTEGIASWALPHGQMLPMTPDGGCGRQACRDPRCAVSALILACASSTAADARRQRATRSLGDHHHRGEQRRRRLLWSSHVDHDELGVPGTRPVSRWPEPTLGREIFRQNR